MTMTPPLLVDGISELAHLWTDGSNSNTAAYRQRE